MRPTRPYFVCLLYSQVTVAGQLSNNTGALRTNGTTTRPETRISANTSMTIPDDICSSAWLVYDQSYSAWSKAAKWKYETHTSTQFFETIQSFGPNRTYTESDGIPRLHFSPSPTISQRAIISVVRSEVWRSGVISASSRPQEPAAPCKDPNLEYVMSIHLAARPTSCNAEMMTSLGVRTGSIKDSSMTAPCLYANYCELSLQEEVILIHWASDASDDRVQALQSPEVTQAVDMPKITASPTLGQVKTIETSALTFRGSDLYLKSVVSEHDGERSTIHVEISTVYSSVLTGPFTFTYPTIYMAHRDITVKRFRGDIYQTVIEGELVATAGDEFLTSTNRPAGIMPLRPEQVFSIKPLHGVTGLNEEQYARSVAQGKFRLPSTQDGGEQTLPLNFADLQDPVPASVYFDARWKDCWGEQKHCATITDDSYRPQLHIHSQVWNDLFPNMSCDVPRLVDPPIVLTRIDRNTMAVPRVPVFGESVASATISAWEQLQVEPSPSPRGKAQPAIASATASAQGYTRGPTGSTPLDPTFEIERGGHNVSSQNRPEDEFQSQRASEMLGDPGSGDGTWHGESGREDEDTGDKQGGSVRDPQSSGDRISHSDRKEQGDSGLVGDRSADDNASYSAVVSRGQSSRVSRHIFAVVAGNVGAIWASYYLFLCS
ncbi:hypothetical protein EJ08DRAFT_692557 [Tothia fuscella]|uniref:Uncharacterized protein n=1 Tax=Tothia fuscella TaxID=1048955 RepID=A0A9P4U2V5_9PEZI|nr:hypothetical protein EJ08DRAFT_692557 [Tothia fuscella]